MNKSDLQNRIVFLIKYDTKITAKENLLEQSAIGVGPKIATFEKPKDLSSDLSQVADPTKLSHNQLMAIGITATVLIPFATPVMAITLATIGITADLVDAYKYYKEDDPWMMGLVLIFTLIPGDELVRLLGSKYSLETIKVLTKKILNKKFSKLTKSEIEIIKGLSKQKGELKILAQEVLSSSLKTTIKGIISKNKISIGGLLRVLYLLSKKYPNWTALTNMAIQFGSYYGSWVVLAKKLGIKEKEDTNKKLNGKETEILIDNLTETSQELRDQKLYEALLELQKLLGEQTSIEKYKNYQWYQSEPSKADTTSTKFRYRTEQKNIKKTIKENQILEANIRTSPADLGQKILRYLFQSGNKDITVLEKFLLTPINRRTMQYGGGEDWEKVIAKIERDGWDKLTATEINILFKNLKWNYFVREMIDKQALFSRAAYDTYLDTTYQGIVKVTNEGNPDKVSSIIDQFWKNSENFFDMFEKIKKDNNGVLPEWAQKFREEFRKIYLERVQNKLKNSNPEVYEKTKKYFSQSFEKVSTMTTRDIENIEKIIKRGFRATYGDQESVAKIIKSWFEFYRILLKPILGRLTVKYDECTSLLKTIEQKMSQNVRRDEIQKIQDTLSDALKNLAQQHNSMFTAFSKYLDDLMSDPKSSEELKSAIKELKSSFENANDGIKWETMLKWSDSAKNANVKFAMQQATASRRLMISSIFRTIKVIIDKLKRKKLTQSEITSNEENIIKKRNECLKDPNCADLDIPTIQSLWNTLTTGSRRGIPTRNNPYYQELYEKGGYTLMLASYRKEVFMKFIFFKIELAAIETLIALFGNTYLYDDPKTLSLWGQMMVYISEDWDKDVFKIFDEEGYGTINVRRLVGNFVKNLGMDALNTLMKEPVYALLLNFNPAIGPQILQKILSSPLISAIGEGLGLEYLQNREKEIKNDLNKLEQESKNKIENVDSSNNKKSVDSIFTNIMTAAKGPGTNEDVIIKEVGKLKSSQEFMMLNDLIKNDGTWEGFTHMINDQFEFNNLSDAVTLKEILTKFGIQVNIVKGIGGTFDSISISTPKSPAPAPVPTKKRKRVP